mmetsp:Transcript_28654/g.66045  ORF Transcript_28654/g.66045 Transcript_28654/m.66045 type:complete len:304 (-) Transcript_28654:426-1337(-)
MRLKVLSSFSCSDLRSSIFLMEPMLLLCLSLNLCTSARLARLSSLCSSDFSRSSAFLSSRRMRSLSDCCACCSSNCLSSACTRLTALPSLFLLRTSLASTLSSARRVSLRSPDATCPNPLATRRPARRATPRTARPALRAVERSFRPSLTAAACVRWLALREVSRVRAPLARVSPDCAEAALRAWSRSLSPSAAAAELAPLMTPVVVLACSSSALFSACATLCRSWSRPNFSMRPDAMASAFTASLLAAARAWSFSTSLRVREAMSVWLPLRPVMNSPNSITAHFLKSVSFLGAERIWTRGRV